MSSYGWGIAGHLYPVYRLRDRVRAPVIPPLPFHSPRPTDVTTTTIFLSITLSTSPLLPNVTTYLIPGHIDRPTAIDYFIEAHTYLDLRDLGSFFFSVLRSPFPSPPTRYRPLTPLLVLLVPWPGLRFAPSLTSGASPSLLTLTCP